MLFKRNVLLRSCYKLKFKLDLLFKKQRVLIQSCNNVTENVCIKCEVNKESFTQCVLFDTYINNRCTNCFIT